jgi:hypothetical protein
MILIILPVPTAVISAICNGKEQAMQLALFYKKSRAL